MPICLKKIVASAASLAGGGAGPIPTIRCAQEFDPFVHGFIEQLRTSKDYARRAEKLKRDFLARPELGGLARGHVGEPARRSSNRTRSAENR